MTHPVIADVTRRLTERSAATRGAYLERVRAAAQQGPARGGLGCANLAHGFAASGADKDQLKRAATPNVAIVSSYNDMLSAHQPFDDFPAQIKAAARDAGGTAQFAGGVPAMCDGITQGRAGMELSLYSRDVIAMATAIALSHDMFDAALMLGVCDKIVPGLLIGALSFGHLPTLFVPAGPMTSGLSNALKSKVRQQYADRRDRSRRAARRRGRRLPRPRHLHVLRHRQLQPDADGADGAAPARRQLRQPGHAAAHGAHRGRRARGPSSCETPVADIVDEHAVVNGVVALLATGGSTNHTMHLVAMARAAGIDLRWDDFADLSAVVPLLARIYPNGKADINHFHAAGGTAFLVRELVDAGLMHRDVQTVVGPGLDAYTTEPMLVDGRLTWRDGPTESLDLDVLRPVDDPFDKDGGLRMLAGNLGRAVIKTSAVVPEQRLVEAPARVFGDQSEFQAAFEAGELSDDLVAVVRYQGPKANGMPELHKLITPLGVLQDRGHRVALVTDGRMSGASGKIPAAIHVTPEAAALESPLARVCDGDRVRLDADAGTIEVLVDHAEFAARPAAAPPDRPFAGTGRELFESFRHAVGPADAGASIFGDAA